MESTRPMGSSNSTAVKRFPPLRGIIQEVSSPRIRLPGFKHLGSLLSPLFVSLALTLSGFAVSQAEFDTNSDIFYGLGFVVLYICAMPAVERLLNQHLQDQYSPFKITDTPKADLIVVLGGALLKPTKSQFDSELHAGSNRLLHTFRLYRAAKAPKIFIATENFSVKNGVYSESFYCAKLLEEWGIPSDAVTVEGSSGSTRENAIQTFEYLKKNHGLDQTVLLVTSSIHMPRAIAAFKKCRLNVIACSTDLGTYSTEPLKLLDFLPSVSALNGMSKTWFEYQANWLYRMKKWV